MLALLTPNPLPTAPDEAAPAWTVAAQVVAWSIPALAALGLALRSPRGERRQWGLIAAVCGVFATDELLNILGRAHRLAQYLARTLDPENSFRGSNLVWRAVILGAGALGGIAVLVFLFRGGRVGFPKWVAFTGLCTIVAYVILRLMPGIGHVTSGPVGLGIQALAWCLLVGGAVLELDRDRPEG